VETSPRTPADLTDGDRLETLGLLAAGLAHEVASPLQALIHNLRYLQDGLAGLDPVWREAAALDPEGAAPAIAAVTGALATLSESYPLDELQSALADSVDAAQRASAMVRAIAEFAQAGSVEEAVDLVDLVPSVTQLTRNAWKYIAEVDTVLPPDLPRVRANPRALGVAFARAMLDAARRLAEREGGMAVEASRILVDAAVQHDTVELAVTAAGHRHGLSLPVAEA
jgi:signal transduction histidine kinase